MRSHQITMLGRDIPEHTTSITEAGLPDFPHEEAVIAAACAGKLVLVTFDARSGCV